MDYLILNDIPTPWREPVFERVYHKLTGTVQVVYFKDNEKRRLWTFNQGSHPKTVLRSLTITTCGKERFFNPGILPFLLRQRPRVALIFTSFKDPTGWLALLICRVLGTKIALLEDTWLGRDRGINGLQRLARRIGYNCFGDAFVGASRQTLAMFKHYNRRLIPEQLFLSHLVADNDYFKTQLSGKRLERRFDVMFSGRIVPVKNPEFFAKVCAGVKARIGRCRVLIIGEGQADLKAAMRTIFERHGVEYEFTGFIKHAALPDYYAQAKLLLMPTSGDCWGVVINEAMLAGTPVITTEMTAAAGELVLHEQNGYVLPLDVDAWTQVIVEMLKNEGKWELFSRNAQSKVQEFTFDNAAAGIMAAFRYLEAPGGTSASMSKSRYGPRTKHEAELEPKANQFRTSRCQAR
ncbi:MAG: glycosyltransferase family 4 protein [Planctomycetes bacterium]|nr:glycosyltransferase family 4 protein [Planctomycetota bacterium]